MTTYNLLLFSMEPAESRRECWAVAFGNAVGEERMVGAGYGYHLTLKEGRIFLELCGVIVATTFPIYLMFQR